MALISYEEFQKTDAYSAFAKQNSDVGYLKVQAFMADQAIPIPDVEILITKEIGDDVVIFFRGYTDSSGIIDNITLPAPADTYNVSTETFSEFEVYDLTAIKESFQTLKKYTIGMFGGLKALQYIKMIPMIQGGSYAR
ncbi:MAG: hypothetical protein SOZ06_00175 [Candidatus Faecenecus gallistercoris]|nr:hypothetical protein [Bacillota bacterium]MDY4050379.1 hypothetical protein [Candidatus Faecenecus gallistercoris]